MCFSGIDRKGNRYNVTVSSVNENSCTLHIKKNSVKEQEVPQITIFQCLPKGRKMDQIVRQVVEAGAKRVVPLISERTIPRLQHNTVKKKTDRWRRIAEEAVKQCGASYVPEVFEPVKLRKIHEFRLEDEIGLFFHQLPIDNKTLHKYLSDCPPRIGIVIGPEGGLTDEEIRYLKDLLFVPVYLGPNILRTETVAVVAVATIQLLYLEYDSWRLR